MNRSLSETKHDIWSRNSEIHEDAGDKGKGKEFGNRCRQAEESRLDPRDSGSGELHALLRSFRRELPVDGLLLAQRLLQGAGIATWDQSCKERAFRAWPASFASAVRKDGIAKTVFLSFTQPILFDTCVRGVYYRIVRQGVYFPPSRAYP